MLTMPVRPLAAALLAAAVLAPAAARAQSAPPAAPPNIVFILADDLGYGDLGVQGHPTIRTPRLDRLAAEGVRMTVFYAAPSCSPSRYQYLAGRYPIRGGVYDALMPESKAGLAADEVTIADLAKRAGYRTMAVGKWHLGTLPEFLPTRHGFDEYFGLLYSNDMIRPWVQTDVPLRLYRGTEALPGEVDVSTLTERYTEEAVGFIRRNRERPFFLYLAHSMPHVPLGVTPRFAGTSAAGRYGDVIEMIDWSTGAVLDALREAGVADRTLVIFASDNGPWAEMPDRMLVDPRVVRTDSGSAGPLRGSKASTWEGGVRVPFIARWPGRIPAGLVTPAMGAAPDLLPTIARVLGQPLPANRVLDGRDLTPVLTGASREGRPEFLYVNSRRLEAARDARWKLRVTTVGGAPKAELFDLVDDISERYDQAAAHPDIVARLWGRMQAFAGETGAKLAGDLAIPPAAFDVQQVAPGVHVLVQRKPPGFLMDPNVTFIVNDEDVVVVDTNLTPASAEASIRALRAITSKPVRTVVNTHWHVDHTSGNQVYRREFPGVAFVGQRQMRDDMVAKGAQNRKDMGAQAADFVAMLKGLLKDGKTFGGGPLTPSERAGFEADITLTEALIAAIPTIEIVPPTVVVDDQLVLQRGRRRIEIRNLGRSHTHGDLVVWLPAERVAITGDLVVGPTPLIDSDQSFIGDWARSLDALLALHPALVVPGHGSVTHDAAPVVRLRDFLLVLDRHAAAALARGETLEQARKTLDVAAFRDAMAGDDPMLRLLFANYGSGPGLAAAFRDRAPAK